MLKDVPAVEPPAEPDPQTAEIFSQDQLEAHAERIAATHRLAANPRRGRPLLPRLDQSAERLEEAYRFLSAAGAHDPQPVASEDWLRDNHHVVQDQVREIRQDLPRNYYLELPKLADGPLQGYPRVYLLARELIAHTAGTGRPRDARRLRQRLSAEAPLSIGKSGRSRSCCGWRSSRSCAGSPTASSRPGEAARRPGDGTKTGAQRRLDRAHILRLLQEGRQEDNGCRRPSWWSCCSGCATSRRRRAPRGRRCSARSQEQDDSADEMLRLEHQREAADQLAIGNVITSMRRVSSIDWTLFFERVSLVEQLLRDDPAGAYALMDFSDARPLPAFDRGARQARAADRRPTWPTGRSSWPRTALRDEPAYDRRHHVGYYLISRGRFRLEGDVGYTPKLRERFARFAFRHPALGYLGAMAATTAASVASLMVYAARREATHGRSVARRARRPAAGQRARHQPPAPDHHGAGAAASAAQARACGTGITPEHRTIVAVPAIVDSSRARWSLLDDLEVRFLGQPRRAPPLRAAQRLSGRRSASAATARPRSSTPRGDAIDVLNARYGAGRFFFFHRERRWNPGEGRWMGWERKRGKLTEFNHLLRGATTRASSSCHGDLSLLTR